MKKITLLFISLLALNAYALNIAKGTTVTLADGSEVSIEEVRENDLLLTLDAKNNNILVSKVKGIKHAPQSKMYKITLADGLELTLTADHPILSSEGWASADVNTTILKDNYKDENIKEYKVDTFVYSTDSNMKIEILPIISVEEINEELDSYSLELEAFDVAFIANGIFIGQ